MGAYSLTLCKENCNSFFRFVGASGDITRIYYNEKKNCADVTINGALSKKEIDFMLYCIEVEKPGCNVSITAF